MFMSVEDKSLLSFLEGSF